MLTRPAKLAMAILLMTLSVPAGATDAETGQALDAALNGNQRSAENKARDVYRHPRATLEFFGIEAHMTVVEFWPGGGWYTEILAPALRGSGKLVAAHYGENTGSDYRTRNYLGFMEKLASRPEIYDQVKVMAWGKGAGNALGQDGSADMVVTFRNLHSLIRDDQLDAFLDAAFRVLKPGGILGVVQHRGKPVSSRGPGGSDIVREAESGYVPQGYVIDKITGAGFVLDGQSELNANPRDIKDYPEGVWTLPPSLGLGDTDREKYLAIGESDRMTLRFLKPAD
jgi:predicted methyltransferase